MSRWTPLAKHASHVDHVGSHHDKQEQYSNIFHEEHVGLLVAKTYGPNHRADAELFIASQKLYDRLKTLCFRMDDAADNLSGYHNLRAVANEIRYQVSQARETLALAENSSRGSGMRTSEPQAPQSVLPTKNVRAGNGESEGVRE